jgi:acyl-coenzyme A thioesterase 13
MIVISFSNFCEVVCIQAEVIVDGSVVRSGRNLTVVAVEFKLRKTGQLVYTARATFYNMPIAKL